ncbi:TPA: hypothetical protein ROY17_004784 [Bacillus thuringiensis]|nr:hypothetical protein [Bacillus thuringiensis]
MQKRKKAKKAILVTSVAFTLGLAEIGPLTALNTPIIAHADTDTGNKVIQILGDGSIQLLSAKLSQDEWVKKTLYKMGGTVLDDCIGSANQNGIASVNDFARDMFVASSSLIPYGGVLISPMIGLLWPTDGKANATKQLIDQISKIIDGKIIDYDNEALATDLKNAHDDLKNLEDSLQGTSHGGTPNNVARMQEEPEDHNRDLANQANASLRKLINNCQKSSFQKSELPIYTLAAAAHLELLSFLVENGEASKSPNFKYAANSMAGFKNELAAAINDYRDHIVDTYMQVGAVGNYPMSTVHNPAFNAALIYAKNTYVKNGEMVRKVDNNFYTTITTNRDSLEIKSSIPNKDIACKVYINGEYRFAATAFTDIRGYGIFSPDDVVMVTAVIDGLEITVLDGYKFKDIPEIPPTMNGVEKAKGILL